MSVKNQKRIALLRCETLDVSIAGKPVCRNLDLQIDAGECWGILGRNGVGKTTFLHTLANLHAPDSGVIEFFGRPVGDWPRKKLAQKMGILLQEVSDPFPSTVLETALIGRHPHLAPWQSESPKDHSLAMQALAKTDMAGLASRDVTTLSGGERQRLALASLLTQTPQVFLLDEPTNHLDLHYQIALLQLLRDTVDTGRENALMMSMHDVNLAARFCSHLILFFGNGEVCHGPTEVMLSADILQKLYGHAFISVKQNGHTVYLPE